MKKIFLLIAIIFIALLSCPIFAQEGPGADQKLQQHQFIIIYSFWAQ